jgi:hypothetical protein
MLVIDKEAVPEYIVEFIKQNLKDANIIDEDEYFDEKHTAIDDWVVGSTAEAKELVDDFGVLLAIRLYKQNYGEFILDDYEDDDDKVYMTLAYNIISDWFNEHFSYEELKE